MHGVSLRRTTGLILLLAGLAGAGCAQATERLRVCIDQVPWPPYTYPEQGEAAGLHVELLREAFSRAGQPVQFLLMPWVRCLLEVRSGAIDAAAPLVFNSERNEYLIYPDGTDADSRSPLALADIDDVVVTLSGQAYDYVGDLATLPPPVRVPRGWEIVEFLEGAGVDVDDGAPSDDANLSKLLRDRSGSVIAIADSVRLSMRTRGLADQVHVSRQPIRTKSMFIAFSRLGRTDPKVRQSIWQHIAELRGDADYYGELNRRYIDEAAARAQPPAAGSR